MIHLRSELIASFMIHSRSGLIASLMIHLRNGLMASLMIHLRSGLIASLMFHSRSEVIHQEPCTILSRVFDKKKTMTLCWISNGVRIRPTTVRAYVSTVLDIVGPVWYRIVSA